MQWYISWLPYVAKGKRPNFIITFWAIWGDLTLILVVFNFHDRMQAQETTTIFILAMVEVSLLILQSLYIQFWTKVVIQASSFNTFTLEFALFYTSLHEKWKHILESRSIVGVQSLEIDQRYLVLATCGDWESMDMQLQGWILSYCAFFEPLLAMYVDVHSKFTFHCSVMMVYMVLALLRLLRGCLLESWVCHVIGVVVSR